MERKTHEQFTKETYELVKDDYSVLGEYKNVATKIKIKHNICGHEYDVTPNQFLRGSRCPKCDIKNKAKTMAKTQEQFSDEVYKLVANEYSVLGEYKNNYTKISMKHNICGYEYKLTPASFFKGGRCPKCGGGVRDKDTNYFKEEVFQLVGDDYSVIGSYTSAKEKITMKHNKCRNVYDVTVNHFLNGKRCPKCNESKGEKSISNYLIKNNIQFKSQFRIKECKNIRTLPFDFGVFKQNKLFALIEYDGKQHFEPRARFGGIEGFIQTKHNDGIKDKYCKENKINLIRISWEIKNIEQFLENKLSKLEVV